MITLTAKIYVSDTEIIKINRNNIKSLKRNIADREAIDKPSFGVVSSRGEIQFYDPEFKVLNLINSKGIDTSIKIEIFINNTLAKITKSIGEFYSEKWRYDNNSRLVTVTIKDDLQEWQEVVISQPSSLQNFTYKDLYYENVAQTPSKFKIYISQETLDYLSQITETKSSRLVGNTLWARWQQFCEATMLHIYKNGRGEVVISNHK